MTSQDWVDRDFYADLGVPAESSAEEIKKAYRRLARRYHPDANPGDAGAEERFKAVSEAYTVLSDPDKRAQYDQARRLAASGAGPSGAGGRPGASYFDPRDLFGADLFGTGGSRMGVGDAQDLFDSLFGGGTRARRWSPPQHGVDAEAELELDFRTAVRGGTVTLHVSDGTGTRTRQVRIPAGVTDGQRLRLPGQGHAAGRHGPAGDLYVQIHVRPDEVFGRRGQDLTLRLPVTVPELVFGAQVAVPTLDGTVSVRVPAGSAPGRTLRVRGRGVPRPGGRPGDLLVTLEAAVPEQHGEAALEALRSYAAATADFDPRRELRGRA